MTEQSPSQTRKEREFASHNQDILEAAMHLFADNGYYQTTMQMIADRAEFSVGYLYKHFSSKEQMYQELVEFHFTRLDEIMAESRAATDSPLERIRRSYQSICEHFNHHRDFMRIYHEEIGSEVCSLEDRKSKHYQDLVRELRAALDKGLIRDHDPELLAAVIQGATKELLNVLAERPGENPFDPLPDLIFSLLIDPLRP